MTFKKYEKDGMVAVLVSGGYGAGWSTWSAKNRGALSMDADLVALVLNKDWESLAVLTETKYPGTYQGGMEDLDVEWVTKGKRFEITEYDGAESLIIVDDIDYWVA